MKTLEQLRAERKLTTPSITPTPTPINLGTRTASTTPQMTDVGKEKFNAGISKATRPLQAGLGKVMDVLQSPEYAYGGFLKGAYGEKARQKEEGTYSAGKRLLAGIKSIPTGLKERTTMFDVNPAKELGIKNQIGQTVFNAASSFAIPSLPVGKISKATKLETAVPKLLSKAVETGEKIPGVKNIIEYGKKFPYSSSAPEKFLRKYEEYNRKVSGAAEKASEIAKPLKFDAKGKELPKETQRILGDILGLSEESKSAGKNIQKFYHGTSGEFDSIKTMRQLRKEGSLVEPSNIGGNSPFVHLSEDKNIANQYAKSRAINMGGTPSIKEINVSGNILDLTKHPSEYSSQEKEKLLEIGQKLIDLSGNRGSDARLGAELKNLGRVPKHTMDSRLPNINYFDIEQSRLFPEIIKDYGDSGIKFTDKGIAAGIVNTVAVLPEAITKELPEVIKKAGRAVTPDELKKIAQNDNLVKSTLAKFQKLAEADIKAGADPKIYERFMGKYYGKKLYTSKLDKVKEAAPFVQSKQPRLDLSLYKKRLDLPEEVSRELGQIKEPAYGAALAAYGTGKNIATRDLFKWVAKNYVDKGEDLVKLPKSERLGILSGRMVPKKIETYLNEIISPMPDTVSSKVTKFFKEGKTILSPKQLMRNIPASQIQAYMNPSGSATSIARLPEAISEFKNKGKFYKEAKSIGLVGQTFASNELGKFVPEQLSKFKPDASVYGKLKKAGGAAQNATEEITKLQVFINERKAGKSVIDAAKAAEETGFNYQKVSPYVKQLRSGKAQLGPLPFGIPFITYPMKAAELTAKTAYKQPQRLVNIARTEKAVQSLSPENDEQFLPDYLKQAVRLPSKSPKTGNQQYLNAKYLYPFGNLMDSGTPMGLTPDPIYNEILSQVTNRDAYLMTQAIGEGKDPMDVKTLSDGDILGLPWSGRIRHLLETFGVTPIRSVFKAIDAATKQKVSATSPSIGESALQEMGVPLYQYSPSTGASIQSYERTQKINDAKAAFNKYIKETKPGSPFYKQGLERKRKAWMDAIVGK